jgi:hypothetical protein
MTTGCYGNVQMEGYGGAGIRQQYPPSQMGIQAQQTGYPTGVLAAQPTGYQQSFIQQPGQQLVQPQTTGAPTASKGGSSVKIPNGMVVA